MELVLTGAACRGKRTYHGTGRVFYAENRWTRFPTIGVIPGVVRLSQDNMVTRPCQKIGKFVTSSQHNHHVSFSCLLRELNRDKRVIAYRAANTDVN